MRLKMWFWDLKLYLDVHFTWKKIEFLLVEVPKNGFELGFVNLKIFEGQILKVWSNFMVKTLVYAYGSKKFVYFDLAFCWQ